MSTADHSRTNATNDTSLTTGDESHTPVAVVVGAGRGIGRAVALRLADEGYAVVAAARSSDELDVLAAEFAAAAHAIDCHVLNIAEHAEVGDFIRTVVASHARIDVLVNSAGISYVAPVALADPERAQAVLDVNLTGAFLISRAVVRVMMRQHHGRIVHIGSISADIGAAYNAIYAASKAGVAGLVRSLALEVASLGITVNGVQPGTVHTELFEQTHGARAKIKGISLEEQVAVMESDNPQQRLVTPEDIAGAVAFLVGPDAASVNGQMLSVDGGRSIA